MYALQVIVTMLVNTDAGFGITITAAGKLPLDYLPGPPPSADTPAPGGHSKCLHVITGLFLRHAGGPALMQESESGNICAPPCRECATC